MSSSTDIGSMNNGDNSWIMTSAILVYLMTPGLAFYYGGMGSNKNILNTFFLSFICMGIITVQWILFGYSLAFGPSNNNNQIGSFSQGLVNNINVFYNTNSFYAGTFPLYSFVIFQCGFAVITAALISGAIVGRLKLFPYMIFILFWSTLCYDILANWIWSQNGWLKSFGTLDFAGGLVVHISSGTSGLIASWIIGKRAEFDARTPIVAENVPFVMIGTGLLWIGWGGFNAGSALTATALASVALVNTNLAAAAASLLWVLLDCFHRGKVSIVGMCSGAIVGLVAITPAAGYVRPEYGLLIGCLGTLAVYYFLRFKIYIAIHYFAIDDTLDVFSAHCIGGIVGAICTGLFADLTINPSGADGLIYGNAKLLGIQLLGIVVTLAFSSAITAGILLPMKYLWNITLEKEDQLLGADITLHSETWSSWIRPQNNILSNTAFDFTSAASIKKLIIELQAAGLLIEFVTAKHTKPTQDNIPDAAINIESKNLLRIHTDTTVELETVRLSLTDNNSTTREGEERKEI